jgi:hypothetical protein
MPTQETSTVGRTDQVGKLFRVLQGRLRQCLVCALTEEILVCRHSQGSFSEAY